MTRPLLLVALLFSVTIAHAQGTRLWSQSTAVDFEHGTPQGVAISSLGQLESAPQSKELATTGSTFVWSVAADHAGNAYLATGSPASVLRITAAGAQTRLFATKDLAVQVVRVGQDGALYAALLPSGKVYRLDPSAIDQDEGKATVVFDPAQLPNPATERPKYVWDLAFDPQGRLYIATGAPGGVYRVALTPSGASKPELFFASDEPHIRALLFSGDQRGTLFAGSDGSGLVYRVGPDGKGSVLFEAGKREITALALGQAGQLYVAAVGERGRSPLPPLPVQGNASVTATITFVQPGSVQAFNGNTVIPDGSEIYEIPPSGTEPAAGAPHKLWSSHDDIAYALEATPDGLLAATGNRGRLYRIAEDGSSADIAHLLASQATGFAESPAGLYTATANTGKLYLLGVKAAPQSFPKSATSVKAAASTPGSYESDVFDAQVHSSWGRIETLATGDYELYARTGNLENPLRGWTEWKPVTPNASAPALTASRYVQWKAVLSPGATITSVGVNYLPTNLAPTVDDIVVAPGTRVNAQTNLPQFPQQTSISFPGQTGTQNFEQNGATAPLPATRDKSAVTARWAAHDDNGDELIYTLYYRAEGTGDPAWRLLKDKLTDHFYTFDASLLPDGAYRMKVVASDAPSHTPADALSSERESPSFLIATATPQVGSLAATLSGAALHVTATATDTATPIARAEYSIDAEPWQYVEPAGKLSDSLVEHYDFTVPLSPSDRSGAPHSVTLRVFDRYENAGAAKALAR